MSILRSQHTLKRIPPNTDHPSHRFSSTCLSAKNNVCVHIHHRSACKIPFFIARKHHPLWELLLPSRWRAGLSQHRDIFSVIWVCGRVLKCSCAEPGMPAMHEGPEKEEENLQCFPLSWMHSSACSITLISFPYLVWHWLENGAVISPVLFAASWNTEKQ